MAVEKKDIIDKADHLFNKYGIKSITMDDISREAGISKKTLYSIFKDKTELVTLTVESDLLDWQARLTEIMESKVDAIRQVILINQQIVSLVKNFSVAVTYDLKRQYPRLYSNIKHQLLELFESCFIQNMELGKETGLYRKDLHVEIISKFHVSRLELIEHSDTMEKLLSPQAVDEILKYHIRGIASEKGIKHYNAIIRENNHKNVLS